MGIVQGLLAEFKHETGITRRILERIPDGKDEWTPHEKSMKLAALANHVAELNGWVGVVISKGSLDFAAGEYIPIKPANAAERLQIFDDHVAKSIALLESTNAEDLEPMWSLKNGEMVLFTAPKKVALRGLVFNHIIHHRAQLGVYLRLLNIAVPSTYGPSADESNF